MKDFSEQRRPGRMAAVIAGVAIACVVATGVAGAGGPIGDLPLSAPLRPAPAVASSPAPLRAPQLTAFDAQMIGLINAARTANRVVPLAQSSGLTRYALWWSNQMTNGATGYQLAHNPQAFDLMPAYGAGNRTSWGENVAWSSSTATTATSIFNAYMASPDHRRNILGAGYRFIGMGTVGGAHGLFSTTEFTDKVVPVPPPPPPVVLRDNDFVRDTATGAIYRMAGGAPIYVSSWAAFGGGKPSRQMSPAAIAKLRKYPTDGTFIRTPDTGAVYRLAGGAPIYVSNWAAVGGGSPTVNVDPMAVARAREVQFYNHLRQKPLDGTLVRLANEQVYVVAGGAPLYVASWAGFGGMRPTVLVDGAAIAKAGIGGGWNHLTVYPADNTFLQAYGSGGIYRVLGGRAGHLASWMLVGGPKPYTIVHAWAISKAGSGAPYNHLRP